MAIYSSFLNQVESCMFNYPLEYQDGVNFDPTFYTLHYKYHKFLIFLDKILDVWSFKNDYDQRP